MEEDAWDDEADDLQYDRHMSQLHYERLSTHHLNAGYREGAGEASDGAVVQGGFNVGFREGAALAFHRSMCRSLLTALEATAHLDEGKTSDARGRLKEALQRWEQKAIDDARWGDELQEAVERELVDLLRQAGLPEELTDPAQLAALNPFGVPSQ